MVEEDSLAKSGHLRLERSVHLLSFALTLLFQILVVKLGNLVKEAVAIHGKLVDDLVDDGLHLVILIDASTDSLVENFLADFQDLNNRDLTSVAVIKEACQDSCLIQRDLRVELVADSTEFDTGDIASLVDIEALHQLPDIEVLVLDTITEFLEDGEDNLHISDTLLGLSSPLVQRLLKN